MFAFDISKYNIYLTRYNSNKKEVIDMTKKTLKIEGMSCGHCVAKVEKALTDLEGVETAKVNLDEKLAEIEYDDSKVGLEVLKIAVAEVGYTVV